MLLNNKFDQPYTHLYFYNCQHCFQSYRTLRFQDSHYGPLTYGLYIYQCLEQQPSPYNPFSTTLQNSVQSTGGSVVPQEVVGERVGVVVGVEVGLVVGRMVEIVVDVVV